MPPPLPQPPATRAKEEDGKKGENEMKKAVHAIDWIISNLSDNALDIPQRRMTTRRKRRRHNDNDTTINYSKKGNESNHDNDHSSPQERIISAAPPGLERQYGELLSLLRGGLLGIGSNGAISSDEIVRGHYSNSKSKRNVAALLMGSHGNGKSLVLERCLSSLLDSYRSATTTRKRRKKEDEKNAGNNDDGSKETAEVVPPFRVVRLNGVLIRGDDVGGAVLEIVKCLSEIATTSHQQKRMKKTKEEHDLRFRTKSGFASNLSLLDETLRITA
eukprot:7379929-Ditylum_brightwellii.AAC.1